MAFEQQSYCFPKHVTVQAESINGDGYLTEDACQRTQEMVQGLRISVYACRVRKWSVSFGAYDLPPETSLVLM
jgi:hypothetical protein